MKNFLAASWATVALTISLSIPNAAFADGFVINDFTSLDVDVSEFKDGVFEASATEPGRLIINCTDCADTVLIDVRLARSEDGTEGRYRSGETTIEQMRKLCQDRNPSCTLDAIEVGAAVGWVTSYEQGSMSGSTSVLFSDSDMMVIRSIAPDVETAKNNGATTRATIAKKIIGEN